ncbi:MAG: hypothetical protein AAFU85_28665 [Planctomycetota bacterium]
MSAVIMIVSASAIIFSVKYGLLRGIHEVANAMRWSAKTRGQLTGYATSVPELVCLVSAGIAGVWDAGLWNIASSNIINTGLMLTAVLVYRQFNELLRFRFVDELSFATLAIFVPILLMSFQLDKHWFLVPVLLGFFALYQWIDFRVNRSTEEETDATNESGDSHEEHHAVGSLPFGVIIGLTALVAIIIAGVFLGDATAAVVQQLNIRPAIAGWILGVVTSIPEMVSFFAVYAASKREGTLDELNDTQEALDNLTGSNMANVGVVYPLGLAAFLLVTSVF